MSRYITLSSDSSYRCNLHSTLAVWLAEHYNPMSSNTFGKRIVRDSLRDAACLRSYLVELPLHSSPLLGHDPGLLRLDCFEQRGCSMGKKRFDVEGDVNTANTR